MFDKLASLDARYNQLTEQMAQPDVATDHVRLQQIAREQRELDGLPALIAALEAEQGELRAQLADGSLYATDARKAAQLAARDAAIDDELLAALERLEVLGG